MIDNDKGKIVFVCDERGCHASLATGTRDWHEALQKAKAEGWHPSKEGGEWKHYCEDCWDG